MKTAATLANTLPKIKPVSQLPRYIEPASIEIGDVIRVAWKVGDVEHTRTGQVAHREINGPMRILFASDEQEILCWTHGHVAPRVTLLSKAQLAPQPILDMLEGVNV